jgi:hypothetical protein
LIYRGARAQVLKEMKILFWVACFSRQRERLKVPNTSHIGYIIGGSQTENKYFFLNSPIIISVSSRLWSFYCHIQENDFFCFHHYFSQSMANRIHGCPPYHRIPFNLFLGLGIPFTATLSCNDK